MRLTKLGCRIIPLVAASLLSFSAGGARAQTQPVRARITEAVDETNLVQLRGNVHPLARTEFDQGLVDDSQPMNRMLLLLQRSPEQQATLSNLMEEQLTKGSANYHKWLTPEEFGTQFGPADADIQAVTAWLNSHGFQGIKVGTGRTVIEFSGNVGQVRNAFHTEIHQFIVKGEEHVANVSEPQMPAALAPVAAGVVSLHNFRKRPQLHPVGTFRRTRATGELKPLFTFGSGTSQQFAVGPADFAKIYNSAPLLSPGTPIDGTLQSIAIVGRTNINLTDVQQFRSLFGLPANFTKSNIVLNGPDPGIISSGEETEADLDVQWAGAVAPMAQILLVVTETPQTNGSDGVDLSALYIVDNNLAPVMSDSFGACESAMLTAGNAFYNAMWQQAAAQGITVVVAAGDNGSAGCDPTTAQPNAATQGLAVSGTASTPFNVAMGGTDFDQVGKTPTFWNTANSTLPYTGQSPLTQLSAVGYIPETTWNDSCASGGQASNCTASRINTDQQNNPGVDVVAGSGGPSSIYTTKPIWQTGFGDSSRDIPDVSLFSSNGNNGSSYVVCQADANSGTGSSTTSCDLNSPFQDFQLVGGTSAATPTFAAIMALVNQKTGQRQGVANYVLYGLAKTAANVCNSSTLTTAQLTSNTCVFYDTTKGNNSVACQGGPSNHCSNTSTAATAFGIMTTTNGGAAPAFNAVPGYDMATGLGSVNVANLLANWSSVKFAQSSTTVTAFPLTVIVHGSNANFTVDVTSGSGSGTPTGNVTLIASPSGFAQEAMGPFPLIAGTATVSTKLLPGSPVSGGVAQPYPVVAHYASDGTFGASDSSAVNVTVSQENSQTVLRFVTFNSSGVPIFNTGTMTVAYGSSYILRVDVRNNAGAQCSPDILAPTTPPAAPCPTGTVNLTDNGSPLKDFSGGTTGTATLNSQGYLEDQPIQLSASTTAHSIVASYLGDNSYAASTSSPESVTITQAGTTTTVKANVSSIVSGGSVTLTATVNTTSNGAGPTGTVQFKSGSSTLSSAVTCMPTAATSTAAAFCTATLTTTLSFLAPPSVPRQMPRIPAEPMWIVACLLLIMFLLSLGRLPMAKRRGYACAGLLLFACVAAEIAGCGGGSSGSSGAHTDSITAVYSGDGNYAGSTSTAVPISVQ